jgi:uncharacterized radical SAM protein YgiQ
MVNPAPIFSYRKYWAERFGVAPFLPTSAAEVAELGWGGIDVLLVTGDAYVDHPSFGMAIVGRLLEAQGFRVAILAQPGWQDISDFVQFSRPELFVGITAGNMDSLVNHYTSDRRKRSDDAYTAGGLAGRRPDRAVLVYAQRVREAFGDVPLIIGGIEASLRRIAHYDYWQDQVRRSILIDSGADLLVFGNAERPLVDIAHRLAKKVPLATLRDIRGTAFVTERVLDGFIEWDASEIDAIGPVQALPNPYEMEIGPGVISPPAANDAKPGVIPSAPEVSAKVETTGTHRVVKLAKDIRRAERDRTVIRLPAFEQVKVDPALYAHASRVLHLESNPYNARALIQAHGSRQVWINPPALPLSTKEMDGVYELPFQRVPHPRYQGQEIPAFKMIRHSVTIQRGCFGGCTFCSITEHEGRIIQNRSEDSVIREVEKIRDSQPGFTGVISDLGGPTANMYRLKCRSLEIEANCRKPSCVYPGVCPNLNTDHQPLIRLYQRARALPGIKKVLIASGVRYDLAVESPQYIKELATHHVGGYLKIAPEAISDGPLSLMMKPGIGTYDKFKTLFDQFSREAGKEQYLIPYFIAAHPGTTDADMLELALWLKRNGFRADQVQAFLPGPMASATAMWHTQHNPLKRIQRHQATVTVPKSMPERRLHKAFLRYHDANNWPLLREALKRMGRADLIGSAKHQLIPAWQPVGTGTSGVGKPTGARSQRFNTQHTRKHGLHGGVAKPASAQPNRSGVSKPAGPRPAALGPAGKSPPRRAPAPKTPTKR